jgi:SPP1 gp7 family putative phage head morphogenesis protein
MIRNLSNLNHLLPQSQLTEIARQADEADQLENYWCKRFTEFLDKVTADSLTQLFNMGKVNENQFDFEFLLVWQMYMVKKKAFNSAHRLAKGDPKTIFDLMNEWKKWRRKRDIPRRQRVIAKKMKDDYFKKLKTVWQKHARDFLAGEVVDHSDIIRGIQKDLKKTYADAKTTARTETTLHYNKARRDFYDSNPDITHYLFLAIRDHRTTKWCATRTGLVYEKGSEYLKKETPPCFTGESLILTLDGWKRIDCIGTADYVWTHANRWQRVKKIYRSISKSKHLFQIGCAVATPNHPYFDRSLGFIEAEYFIAEEGLRTSTLNLYKVFKAAMGSLVQARPKVLFKSMSCYFFGGYSKWGKSSLLERWKKEIEVWICGNNAKGTSSSKQTNERRQSSRKFTSDGSERAYNIAQKIGWYKSSKIVFNLEVEKDHTYIAGGYLVHNCHWNCRSEIVPLSILNPEHAKLIHKASIQRANRKPEPLPVNWSSR